MKVPVYNIKGEKTKDIELSDAIFGVAVKDQAVAQVLRAQIANRHQPSAHTLNRGEVRGGGKKPWRQKGTGQARAGSNRSPLWAGGGVTFGPRKTRNISLDVPARMRRRAIAASLTAKAKAHRVAILELPGAITTRKQFLAWCEKLKVEALKILFISSNDDIKLRQAVRNLSNVTTIGIDSVNLFDVLNNDFIVATGGAANVWRASQGSAVRKVPKTTVRKAKSWP